MSFRSESTTRQALKSTDIPFWEKRYSNNHSLTELKIWTKLNHPELFAELREAKLLPRNLRVEKEISICERAFNILARFDISKDLFIDIFNITPYVYRCTRNNLIIN